MTTSSLRACAGLLAAILCASGTMVATAAQTPPQQKKPAVVPAKTAVPATAPKPRAAVPQKPQAAAQKPQPAPAAKPNAPKNAPAPAANPAAAAPAPTPQGPATPAVERVPAPDSYSYKPEGRRDPFLSLVNRAVLSENRPSTKKPEGLRGLKWDEIALRGVFQGRKGPVALVQGPDTRTYQVHVGDQFDDAVVKAITADSLVVLQEVNDPLSLQKQRERRKTLRVAEEVK